MTVHYYPKNLKLPLQSGYSIKYKPSVLRTTMTDGTVRQRLLNVGANATLNCSLLLLKQNEYIEFIDFYKSINYGTEWFVMPVINEKNTEGHINYRLVRMQNGSFNTTLQFFNGETCRKVELVLDIDEITSDPSWREYYE